MTNPPATGREPKLTEAHLAMVAALKAAIKISDDRLDPWLGRTPECQAVYDQCIAALSLAGEKQ